MCMHSVTFPCKETTNLRCLHLNIDLIKIKKKKSMTTGVNVTDFLQQVFNSSPLKQE